MGIIPLGPGYPPGQKFGENPTRHNPHPTFGDYQPNGHTGTDFPAPTGTPVYATEDGVVTWAGPGENLPGDDSHEGWASRYYLTRWATGNLVALEHSARGGYVTLSYHLDSVAPGLKPGDRVRRGQLIGRCGSTGRSTGPHLHLDVIPTTYDWENGVYGRVDPAPYLTDHPLEPIKEETVTAYKLDESMSSPAFTPHRNGRKRPTDVVIHHYGPDDATYESSNAWLTRPGADTSAHYVVDAGRVACLVSPEHTAWHAGNLEANYASIGIENHPIWTQAREDTLVQLCADLEQHYGGMKYSIHRDHTATACPGRWAARLPHIINGINAELERRKNPAPAPKPAPTPTPKKETNVAGHAVWSYVNSKVNGAKDAYALLTETVRGIRDIQARLERIEKTLGEGK